MVKKKKLAFEVIKETRVRGCNKSLDRCLLKQHSRDWGDHGEFRFEEAGGCTEEGKAVHMPRLYFQCYSPRDSSLICGGSSHTAAQYIPTCHNLGEFSTPLGDKCSQLSATSANLEHPCGENSVRR